MTGYVVFQMWSHFREHLVASHEFFVAEARSRLLAQFDETGMEAEADHFAETWLASMSSRFDPDRHDPGDFYEQATDESVAFYMRLQDLRTITRLSIIAGMYHEWEKQLRGWLARELLRLRGAREAVRSAVWSEDIGGLYDLLETWGWPVRDRAYFQDLHLCHLVVNVYKHGNGRSLAELQALEPGLTGDRGWPGGLALPPDHNDLKIGDDAIERFSRVIVTFWRDVPENTFDDQIDAWPRWLEKAFRKDARPSAP